MVVGYKPIFGSWDLVDVQLIKWRRMTGADGFSAYEVALSPYVSMIMGSILVGWMVICFFSSG